MSAWLLNLGWFLRLLIYTVSCIGVGSGIIFFSLQVWHRYEQTMEQRAKRKQQDAITLRAQKDAQITVIKYKLDERVKLADETHSDWLNVDVDPRIRHNTEWTEPTPLEIDLFKHRLKPSTVKSTARLLPSSIDQPVNHFYQLLDIYPHLMIIAPSGSGKSTQTSLAANYLLSQKPESKLVWMSTHALEDKAIIHPKAVVVQKADEIMICLADVVGVYKKRRDNPQQLYQQIIVVLDEWYDLIMSDGDVRDAIAQLSSEARKFGIVLILASHTDKVKDTGLGADFRLNFARVQLDVNLTKQNKAIWKRFDRQDTWVEIELPKRRDLAKQLCEGGMSKNQAALAIYQRSYGGDIAGKF